MSLNTPEAWPLPRWPDTWYIVARSNELQRGGKMDGKIADRAFIIFRSETGVLTGLNAHCPHMGAHLGSAEVIGEQLRCALHHMTIDKSGNLHTSKTCLQNKTAAWPVAERFGLIFIFAGKGEPPSLPYPKDMEEFEWISAAPIQIKTDWYALMINGFDIAHMRTVHQRVLSAPPQFNVGEDQALHFHYTTKVTPDGGLSSWIVKKISNNQIKVHQTCSGTTLLVESDLGAIRSCAIFGFVQEGDTTRVFSSFACLRRGLFWKLKLHLTGYLYIAFLRKDYPIVQDMKIIVDGIDDLGVIATRDFLRSLPVLS